MTTDIFVVVVVVELMLQCFDYEHSRTSKIKFK